MKNILAYSNSCSNKRVFEYTYIAIKNAIFDKKNLLYRSSKMFFTILDKFNDNTEIFVECVIILYMYIQIYIFFYSAKKPSSLRVIRGPVFLSISLKHFKNGQE